MKKKINKKRSIVRRFSRRDFIKKSAIAFGSVFVFDLSKAVAVQSDVNNMSHVSVKLWPGRDDETKKKLAHAIAYNTSKILGSESKSVSVSIEDISSGQWKDKVYDPFILKNKKNLYKKPGYSM